MNFSNSAADPPLRFCLEFVGGPRAGERVPLEGDSLVIGRSDEADLTIDDSTASRKHAEIVFRAGGHIVIDHSSNGTYVNGELITERMLAEGDEMVLGETVLRYVPCAGEAAPDAAAPGKTAQGVSPLVIAAVVVGALVVGAAVLLRPKEEASSTGGKPAVSSEKTAAQGKAAPASASAEAEPKDEAPAIRLTPEQAIAGVKRMLGDVRLRPDFAPEAIRMLEQARRDLARRRPGAERDRLAAEAEALLKRTRRLQSELAQDWERQAQLFTARGEYDKARQALLFVQALVGDVRDPAYRRAGMALEKLPTGG